MNDVDKRAYRANSAGEPWNDPRHPSTTVEPKPKRITPLIKPSLTEDEATTVVLALVEYEKVTKDPAAVTAAIAVVGARIAWKEALKKM